MIIAFVSHLKYDLFDLLSKTIRSLIKLKRLASEHVQQVSAKGLLFLGTELLDCQNAVKRKIINQKINKLFFSTTYLCLKDNW